MKYYLTGLGMVALSFIVFMVIVGEAIDRSRERAACYRDVLRNEAVMADCPVADPWENRVRDILL